MVYPALLPLMRTPRLPVVDWTDAPADLNWLVRFAERRNLGSARVPSHFKLSLLLMDRVRLACTLVQVRLVQFVTSSRSGRFSLKQGVPLTHAIGQWVRLTTGVDALENNVCDLHSFRTLPCVRSTASSKASSPHSEIQCFLFQFPVPSRFLKIIQQLPRSSTSSSSHFYPALNNVFKKQFLNTWCGQSSEPSLILLYVKYSFPSWLFVLQVCAA
jgi:hypothetical protein